MSSRLVDTNPYLRNPVTRERSVVRSVVTSSAIEGIRAPFKGQNVKSAEKIPSPVGRKNSLKR